MNSISFSWDQNKEKENIKKHGITFEEAKSVFYDENAILIHDPLHSTEEDRFIMLGMSLKYRFLVVCHCYRDTEKQIRIISARKANRDETGQYHER
jgi:uncharacterized DUF497 family protein